MMEIPQPPYATYFIIEAFRTARAYFMSKKTQLSLLLLESIAACPVLTGSENSSFLQQLPCHCSVLTPG